MSQKGKARSEGRLHNHASCWSTSLQHFAKLNQPMVPHLTGAPPPQRFLAVSDGVFP